MHKYENLLGVDEPKAVFAADKNINEGWRLASYPVIKLDAIPWEFKGQEQRSWNFHIHSLDMIDSLLKAYSEAQNKTHLEWALSVALDWIHNHVGVSPDNVSPMAWYDMAVGVRAYRLSYLLDACENANLLDRTLIELLWNVLLEHQRYLADDKNIIFHNNHGLYQVAGQLAMGRRFSSRSSLMAEAYEQGSRRLDDMLDQQFSSEGVHREHSPDYHRMVFEALKGMRDSGLIENEQTLLFVDNIERSLSWFVQPSGHIANFGDSDSRLLNRKPVTVKQKWATPEMQFVTSGGEIGCLPEKESVVFKEGGYFIVRKRASDGQPDYSRYSYLAQTAAFHSRTHKHADDLSFIWSDRGQNILVDAGRYGYVGKVKTGSKLWLDGYWYSDPNRVYCESTRAHNTLEFDGKNYRRKGAVPFGCALNRTLTTEDGVFISESEVKQHGSIRHARMLIYKPERWLLVFDWFHDNKKNPHDVRQWFHFSPDLQVLNVEGGYKTATNSAGKYLRVTNLLCDVSPSRLYLGEEKPVMQGWWSGKEREVVPAYAFCYETKKQKTGSFATLFSFTDKLENDVGWSKANVSGRNLRLRWHDDFGTHTINISRPQEGELAVEYKVN